MLTEVSAPKTDIILRLCDITKKAVKYDVLLPITDLHVNDICEVSWFFQVVETRIFDELSDNFIGYLISPLVDHWHVDVVNEYRHLLAGWWTVCGTYSLVYVAFNCSLQKQNT